MAIKALKRVEPSWYTPEDEREDQNPTRFRIRALPASEQLDLYSTFGDDGKPGVGTFKECFRRGVLEIENADDHNGKPIKHAHAFLLQQGEVFSEYAIEVGAAVFDKSFLSGEEEKN